MLFWNASDCDMEMNCAWKTKWFSSIKLASNDESMTMTSSIPDRLLASVPDRLLATMHRDSLGVENPPAVGVVNYTRRRRGGSWTGPGHWPETILVTKMASGPRENANDQEKGYSSNLWLTSCSSRESQHAAKGSGGKWQNNRVA